MGQEYDVAVIGTGTSAYTLAYLCRSAGKSVAMIDSRPYGGTCALRGCQPKKYFIAASKIVKRASMMQGIGIKNKPDIDWSILVGSKNAFTEKIPKETEEGFQRAGISCLHGEAQFASRNSLCIGDREISADKIVIATGAVPRTLQIAGENHLTTSEEFMALSKLPGEIVFVGGGYISFEFAHVAHSCNSKVTILQRGNRVLKRFDPDLVERLVASSRESGIQIELQSCVGQIIKRGHRLMVACLEDPTRTFEADLAIHGAGRIAALQGLNLEAGDVTYTEKGVNVNEYLRSPSNPSVYAIGDAASTPFQLATTADMEGEVAAKNIIHGDHVTADYRVVPSVVFTFPPLAKVGLSEAEAKTLRRNINVNHGEMTGWPSSRRIGQTHAAYKVIIDEKSHQILGAHLLGHAADEAINIFAMAIRFNLKTDDLKQMLWAYPTYISDLKYMIG